MRFKSLSRIGVIIVLFTIAAAVLRAQTNSGAANSDFFAARNQAWRGDLQFFATELPKRHENLFFKITRQDFAREAAKLDAAIPAMRDSEIKIALMRLAAMVGDSHTGVSWRREDFGSFPVQLYSYSDGWFVTATTDEYKRALGARLVQIGETDIERADAALRNLIACENDWCFRYRLPNFLNVSDFLHAQKLIPNAQSGRFVFEDKTGTRFAVEMKAVAVQQWQNVKWNYSTLPPSAREQTSWLRNQNDNYWYEYAPDSKTLYFAYNRCQNIESKPFKDFAEELLAFADSHQVERFVVDLRRNGGGSEALLLPFIAELRRRPNINRKGNLFVVIGRGTFSSAAQNAITLKQKTEAVVVGEPTGQKPNHYGEVKTFRLSNSGLETSYSTTFWKRVDGDPPAFVPDLSVESSFGDLSAGRDGAMTAILNYKRQ